MHDLFWWDKRKISIIDLFLIFKLNLISFACADQAAGIIRIKIFPKSLPAWYRIFYIITFSLQVVKVLDAYKDCFACTEDAEGGKTWKFVAFDTKF